MMLLFSLLACGADECDVVSTEVADDAPLGDLSYTAADLVAAVSGDFEVTASSPEHGGVAATLSVKRAEGPAVFHDATLRARLDHDDVNPFMTEYDLDISYYCNDEVEVPVTVALEAEELGVALVLDVSAKPPQSYGPTGLGEVWIAAQLPVETPGLPAPPEGANRASLSGTLAAGELVRLQLAWSGGDAGSTSSDAILQFPYALGAEAE